MYTGAPPNDIMASQALLAAAGTGISERGVPLITLAASATAGQSFFAHWVADARL